jgi:hypothetical protein
MNIAIITLALIAKYVNMAVIEQTMSLMLSFLGLAWIQTNVLTIQKLGWK